MNLRNEQIQDLTPVLAVEGLSKQYDTPRGPLPILLDVSFSKGPGESLCVMGPSGSGKSTLLHVLGTLEPPSSGRVMIDGRRIPTRSRSRSSPPSATARSASSSRTTSCCRSARCSRTSSSPPSSRGRRGDHEARARELLDRVGLGERLDHRPAELSGGERQRAALARALVLSPRLVLCDEPTGNLDAASAGKVADLLLELHAREQRRARGGHPQRGPGRALLRPPPPRRGAPRARSDAAAHARRAQPRPLPARRTSRSSSAWRRRRPCSAAPSWSATRCGPAWPGRRSSGSGEATHAVESRPLLPGGPRERPPRAARVPVGLRAAPAPSSPWTASSTHATTGRRAGDVRVYGVDERFWAFQGLAPPALGPGREALVSEALAEELGSAPGDAILVRLAGGRRHPGELALRPPRRPVAGAAAHRSRRRAAGEPRRALAAAALVRGAGGLRAAARPPAGARPARAARTSSWRRRVTRRRRGRRSRPRSPRPSRSTTSACACAPFPRRAPSSSRRRAGSWTTTWPAARRTSPGARACG